MTADLERQLAQAREEIRQLQATTAELESRLSARPHQDDLRLALDAAALVGTWDWDMRHDRIFADARFAALYGLDPEDGPRGLPIERYTQGVHEADRPALIQAIDEAIRTGDIFAHQYRTRNRDGETRWVFARGRVFFDPTNQPVRFPGAVVDVTREKRRAERQDALLRLGDLVQQDGSDADLTAQALALLGEALDIQRVGYATVDAAQHLATIAAEWCAPGVVPLSGPLPIARFGAHLLEALRGGLVRIEDVEDDPLTRKQADAWEHIGSRSLLNLTVVRDDRVEVILFLHARERRAWPDDDVAFVRDVLNRTWISSQRRQAQLQLVDAERRLRNAHEAAALGVFELNLATGALTWDRRCREVFGIADGAIVTYPETVLAVAHPDDRDALKDASARAFTDMSDPLDLVYRIIRPLDGQMRHVHATAQVNRNDRGEPIFVGLLRDVTTEKEGENRQRLLARELQHRVKNTLAIVKALANQTLRRAPSTAEGLANFAARLDALSQAHDVLTATNWTGAAMHEVVAGALATHETGDGDARRIRFGGPDIALDARQSLALSLALHELATNAVKYGALSADTGRVDLHWWIESGDTEPVLRIEWRESDGPAVAVPEGRGFGSRLIEQSLASDFGGTVALRFEPGGLVAEVRAPVPDGRIAQDHRSA
ncbi:PAS domain-containing protein [Aureimonas jatrophae]|uniref:Blue-light-activated histidine kinase n=1 Tax=Aureimonas jatrophae TaxID=1166073 RepID=A0A1H0J6P7_9HYPH|nr:PAS domain-containing protein [Aureimonas jatrophae]MBB3951570.1 PAS domain S-box-containing protein [Aureimonas jatrophae]SDO39292.1 PAS domain S-box-containing protein [Aureimonas jatrophae]